jgi:formylglycine-generating enzyme required for sulfatase activity
MPTRILTALALIGLVLALPLGGAPAPRGSSKELINSIGMKLVLIPKGTFQMGAAADEAGALGNDRPRHEVEISRPFYLGAYEVTQKQYKKVLGTNPSSHSAGGAGRGKVRGIDTGDFPVEQTTWNDAVAFCKKLSALPAEKGAGRAYRLPSEAEWEYACRAGTKTPFAFGKSLSSRQANINGNPPYGGAEKGPYLDRTCKVGSYKPNAWGLFDMHGNVWEWCADWYGNDYYKKGPRRDPTGPALGGSRVLRGGCWYWHGLQARSAYRSYTAPDYRNRCVGFRVACTTPKLR